MVPGADKEGLDQHFRDGYEVTGHGRHREVGSL